MAIKKFRIKLDGVIHEVEVEELNSTAKAAAPMPVTSPPQAEELSQPEVSQKNSTSVPPPAEAADSDIVAPLPGTILDVYAAAGQSVKLGDVLLIIEAMKMENEIVAPRNGTVTAVFVNKGDTVNPGGPLLSLQ